MSTQPVRFWDRIAERYATNPISDEVSYQRKLALTRQYLTPDMEVFEFGCGTGSTALSHAPFVRHIHACDLSPRMIEIAGRKAEQGGVDNVLFDTTPVEDGLAEAERWDAVLGLNILHLLPQWRATVSQAWTALRPGGVFVTSTPCLGDSFFRVIAWISPLAQRFGVIPRVEGFRTADLVSVVESAGFTVEVRWQPGPRKALFIIARKAVTSP